MKSSGYQLHFSRECAASLDTFSESRAEVLVDDGSPHSTTALLSKKTIYSQNANAVTMLIRPKVTCCTGIMNSARAILKRRRLSDCEESWRVTRIVRIAHTTEKAKRNIAMVRKKKYVIPIHAGSVTM